MPRRRKFDVFTMSFLDTICCAFGAIVLIYMIINAAGARSFQKDTSELRAEVGGRLRAAGLVVGVHLEPHRRRAHVERHRDQVGVLVAEQLDQHRREAVDRVRDGPGAGRQGLRQREERPVREAVTVQQEESTRGL